MTIEQMLQRHTNRDTEVADSENIDDLGGYGVLRGIRDRAYALELRKKDDTALAIPYGLDARDQLGLSTDDEDATRSAVCSTGAYGRALFDDRIEQPAGVTPIVISPGDIDEGVIFLLTYGNDPEVIRVYLGA